MITVQVSGRPHCCSIGTIPRLSEPERTELFAPGVGQQPRFFLCVRSVTTDRVTVERIIDGHNDTTTGAPPADLFHRQDIGDIVSATAPFLFRYSNPHQAQFGHLGNSGSGIFVTLIPRRRIGRQPTIRQLGAGFPEHLLSFVQIEVHLRPLRSREL